MTEPQIVLGYDPGFHNRSPQKTAKRVKTTGVYRDLSTVCVIPTRGNIPSRVAETWMGMMTPMNQPFVRLWIRGMEVGAAYEKAIDIILTNDMLKGFKYLLTLEEDNMPPPDGLLKLYENIEQYQIVGGLYFTKGEGGMPMIYGDPKGILAFNPQRPLPGKVQECVSPETQVLTANLTWEKAQDVAVADVLLGVDEYPRDGKRRRLVPSPVKSRIDFIGERLLVETDKGDIVVSHYHQFLASHFRGRQGNAHAWVEANNLRAGDEILFLSQPWESKPDSWLAGVIDGEGNLASSKSSRSLTIAQNPGPVFDRIKAEIESRDVSYSVHPVDRSRYDCLRAHVARTVDVLRLLGTTQPTRLMPEFHELLSRGSFGATKWPKAKVLRVTNIGPGRLIGFRTGSRTLITDGLVSHNCNGVGMGFTLFDLELFRAGKIERPFFKSVQSREEGQGTQDLYFMANARRAGYRVASDNRVRVGHYDSREDMVW